MIDIVDVVVVVVVVVWLAEIAFVYCCLFVFTIRKLSGIHLELICIRKSHPEITNRGDFITNASPKENLMPTKIRSVAGAPLTVNTLRNRTAFLLLNKKNGRRGRPALSVRFPAALLGVGEQTRKLIDAVARTGLLGVYFLYN